MKLSSKLVNLEALHKKKPQSFMMAFHHLKKKDNEPFIGLSPTKLEPVVTRVISVGYMNHLHSRCDLLTKKN